MALVLRTLSWCLNGDETQGSIYCRKNYDEPIRPEWQVKPAPENMTGVFVPVSLNRMVLTARVENTGDDAVDATLSAQEITSEMPVLGSPGFPSARFPAHQTIEVRGTVNPTNLKNFWNARRRHRQSLTWRWSYAKAIGGQPVLMGDTLHILYFLPQLPAAVPPLWNVQQGPYDVNNKACVWTELLDACSEACDQYAARYGGQAPASDKEYVAAFAAELNGNPAFHYDVWSGACSYLSYSACGGALKLEKYLRDRRREFSNYLNCSDCAAIVAVEALAYGIGAYIGHMRNGNAGFRCNPVIAIGCSAWAPPFQGGFSYHAVAVLDAACSETAEIYDACLHLDGGEYPGSPGPQGKTPLLPAAIPFSDTPAPRVNVPAGQPFTKKLYRERLVADQEACVLEAQTMAVTAISPSLALSERLSAPFGMREGGENPLPASGRAPVWKRLSAALFQKLGSWKQTEAYGRYRVYLLTDEEGACIQASFWAALDSEEAWALLQARICEISCPLEAREFADTAYGVGRHFLLFAYGGLIVELNGYGRDVQKLAEQLEACLRRAQPAVPETGGEKIFDS